ncbi:MAG: hypothetical protein AL399_01430 [Candidatus [Bacteroides] periocalifornicus]|uniref:SGNH hydrolase-type esterase domain-containing protein n=1 Tax=Candidatus [Bacteroides] periocalifornicus TaxID=1702214 RepID=A0A0Q4B6G2_9BACT|nr:MAG: hypothetical protein AL399_01430 [Candidatus [Bacteroides] periocalifornicus]
MVQFRRVLFFLSGILLLLYALTWLGRRYGAPIDAQAWLPSARQFPGLRSSVAPRADVRLADSTLKLVEAIDSLDMATDAAHSSQRAVKAVGRVMGGAMLSVENEGAEQPSGSYPFTPEPSRQLEQSPILADAMRGAKEIKPSGNVALPEAAKGDRRIKTRALEYTDAGFNQLAYFFDALGKTQLDGAGVRILHYGDSQIEGDRVTGYLRSRMQRVFGGAGVGMQCVVPPVSPPFGLTIQPGAGWKYHSIMPATKRKKEFHYGLAGSVCQYGQEVEDAETGETHYQGTVEITRKLSAGSGMRFSHVRVFIHTAQSPCRVELQQGDSTLWEASIGALPSVQQVVVPVSTQRSKFSLSFSSASLADVLALSFEGEGGVQVDNVPLRGSSGGDFTAINDTVFREMASLLHPKLVLLQFGVNVVPGQMEAYGFYREMLKRQIARLRGLLPGVTFIMLGVSDMGMKEEDDFVSYPNIPKVRNAQRQAALESGIAFWDTYQAMGGPNSIVAWVNAEPPLATADYVHFTPRGARFIGEMFYSALMQAYEAYTQGASAPQK